MIMVGDGLWMEVRWGLGTRSLFTNIGGSGKGTEDSTTLVYICHSFITRSNTIKPVEPVGILVFHWQQKMRFLSPATGWPSTSLGMHHPNKDAPNTAPAVIALSLLQIVFISFARRQRQFSVASSRPAHPTKPAGIDTTVDHGMTCG